MLVGVQAKPRNSVKASKAGQACFGRITAVSINFRVQHSRKKHLQGLFQSHVTDRQMEKRVVVIECEKLKTLRESLNSLHFALGRFGVNKTRTVLFILIINT